MLAMSIAIVSAMILTENTHLNYKLTMSIFPDAHNPSTSKYYHIIREVILTGDHDKFQHISMSGECFHAMDLHSDSVEIHTHLFPFSAFPIVSDDAYLVFRTYHCGSVEYEQFQRRMSVENSCRCIGDYYNR
ncbi:unnamed protein product [Adineta ricciae]|uniref:Uncharacterized protein n=1 Tax=Adineta ricciae TaxID=249248 RepID=A0A814WUD1_ADIRI|nr:unnamed protein product [Adineta ricciae]CAF1270786.1 unnamed protein product [Adineta ricciae]